MEEPKSLAAAQDLCGGKTCSWVLLLGGVNVEIPRGIQTQYVEEMYEQQGVMFMSIGFSPSLTYIYRVVMMLILVH